MKALVSIAAALVVLVPAATARAQPGTGLGTGTSAAYNALTGSFDYGSAFGINAGFDMMGVLLQQQVFLNALISSDPQAFRQAVLRYRAKVRHEVAARAAKGQKVIRRGRATTRFHPVQAARVQQAVAKAFGGGSYYLRMVATDLEVYMRSYAPQLGLSTDDMADTYVAAAGLALEIWSGRELPHGALADLRSRTRPRILRDPVLQGMSNEEKTAVHQILVVSALASAIDYLQAQNTVKNGLLGQDLARQKIAGLRKVARRVVKLLVGVPPERIRITAGGLVLP